MTWVIQERLAPNFYHPLPHFTPHTLWTSMQWLAVLWKCHVGSTVWCSALSTLKMPGCLILPAGIALHLPWSLSPLSTEMISMHPSRVSEDINALRELHPTDLFIFIYFSTWRACKKIWLWWHIGRQRNKHVINSVALEMNIAKGSKKDNLHISTTLVKWPKAFIKGKCIYGVSSESQQICWYGEQESIWGQHTWFIIMICLLFSPQHAYLTFVIASGWFCSGNQSSPTWDLSVLSETISHPFGWPQVSQLVCWFPLDTMTTSKVCM